VGVVVVEVVLVVEVAVPVGPEGVVTVIVTVLERDDAEIEAPITSAAATIAMESRV
jgi:hypothetical protein